MRRLPYMAVALIAAAALWVFAVPAVATRAGWATRWPLRLPASVQLHGRSYGNPGGCVTRRHTPFGWHRPGGVGAIPAVLGSDIPLVESAPSRGRPADVVVAAEPSNRCYVVYGLEGGP
jgi:hypothetical protein